MNICVYGAASMAIDKKYILESEKLGEKIAEKGFGLVFGGGSNGVMGAAARGAKKNNGKIIGIAPKFFDADGVLFPGCTEFIYTETMRERKKLLEDNSDAFIIAPGGIGTLDEFFEMITLKQLGRTKKPIVIYNLYGYYDPLIVMLNKSVKENFMTDKSLSLFKVCQTVDEIFDYLDNYEYENISLNDLKSIEKK